MSYRGIISLMPKTAPLDTDALAFITAAGITDPTQQTSIYGLVADLKSNNLWTKMKAIYPFVGGTATAHKYNLKDPRDLDAAFRLQFFGGITHNSNGITGNASNAYANTFFVNSVNSNGVYDNSSGIYSRTDSNGVGFYDFGSMGTGGSAYAFTLKWGGITYTYTNRSTAQQFADANSLGLYQIGATGNISANDLVLYKNGTAKATSLNVSGYTLTNSSNYILARNNGSNIAEFYTGRNIAFAFIGDGLNASESLAMYNVVQNYQTILSRNV